MAFKGDRKTTVVWIHHAVGEKGTERQRTVCCHIDGKGEQWGQTAGHAAEGGRAADYRGAEVTFWDDRTLFHVLTTVATLLYASIKTQEATP